MATQLQLRRGTNAQVTAFTGAEGEVSVNTTNDSLHVHDGSTAGGFELARADLNNVSDTDLNAALTGNTVSALTVTALTTAGLTTTGNISFGDNDKAIFGAGSDLQIYHDGTSSTSYFIESNATGNMEFRASSLRLKEGDGGNYYFLGVAGGASTVYHNGSAKLATTATGIDVTGTVTADGLTLGSEGDQISIPTSAGFSGIITTGDSISGNAFEFKNGNGIAIVSDTNDSAVTGGVDATLIARGSSATKTALFDANGDVSLFEDTGTTAKFAWSASNERLVLSTSGAYALDARASGTSSATMAIFSNSNGSDKAAIRLDANGDGELVLIDAGNNEDVVITAGGDSYFNGGSVGIGTSSPNNYANFTTLTLDGTNGSEIDLEAAGTLRGQLYSTTSTVGLQTGSATNLPIVLGTNGTERMRIDASGNVGIGVTPATDWNTAYDALQIGQGSAIMSASGSEELFLNMNAKWASDSSWEYIATGTAASIRMDQTTPFTFRYAASGSADADLTWSEAMRIDSSGNLLVGRTSASYNGVDLHVGNTSDSQNGLQIETSTTGYGFVLFGDGTGADAYRGQITYKQGDDYMSIHTAGSERMRLDASGNLLVGTTTITGVGGSSSPEGVVLDGNNAQITVGTSSDVCATFNRQTTDGSIVQFRKDGTTVGSIGTVGGYLGIANGDTGLLFRAPYDDILPYTSTGNTAVDATIDIGDGSYRFKDLYLSGGVRNVNGDGFNAATDGGETAIVPAHTSGPLDNQGNIGLSSFRWKGAYITNGVTTGSDERDKQDIETLSDAEQRVAVACKGLLRKWRWKDAVENKGDEARIHFGIIAQDLQAAFEAEGLDAGRYAMFMSNTWTDEETGEERTRLGVRYHELLAFIIAAI